MLILLDNYHYLILSELISSELLLLVHKDLLSWFLEVSLVLYNETQKINLTNEEDIKNQINRIIQNRYQDFDNAKIDLENNPILRRITYIVFPIWKNTDTKWVWIRYCTSLNK